MAVTEKGINEDTDKVIDAEATYAEAYQGSAVRL